MTPASIELANLADDARGYMDSAKAPATVRGYSSDWRQFAAWCDQRGLDALPAAPATVALYLSNAAAAVGL